jgi:hypothetical protein
MRWKRGACGKFTIEARKIAVLRTFAQLYPSPNCGRSECVEVSAKLNGTSVARCNSVLHAKAAKTHSLSYANVVKTYQKGHSMQTREIPQTDWPRFIHSFSSRHQGWLVNVEVFGPNIGAQVQGTGLVLQGLTNESDAMNRNSIVIMAGNRIDDHVTHSINRPTQMSLEKTDNGMDAALCITAEDGTRTLLSFPSFTRNWRV